MQKLDLNLWKDVIINNKTLIDNNPLINSSDYSNDSILVNENIYSENSFICVESMIGKNNIKEPKIKNYFNQLDDNNMDAKNYFY